MNRVLLIFGVTLLSFDLSASEIEKDCNELPERIKAMDCAQTSEEVREFLERNRANVVTGHGWKALSPEERQALLSAALESQNALANCIVKHSDDEYYEKYVDVAVKFTSVTGYLSYRVRSRHEFEPPLIVAESYDEVIEALR